MSVNTSFYVNSSTVGVDLNNTNTTAQFSVGTRVNGSSDSLWVYVEANGVMTTGDLVTITTAGTATRCLTSGGSNAALSDIAFAQTAFADGEYGWVLKNGANVYVAVSSTAALSAVLYVATSSGKLSTTSASGTLMGVSLLAAVATATTTVTNANVTWPKWANTGN